jgi:hypothetical protein
VVTEVSLELARNTPKKERKEKKREREEISEFEILTWMK